jgi:DNA-binding transcriptional regulator YiaG
VARFFDPGDDIVATRAKRNAAANPAGAPPARRKVVAVPHGKEVVAMEKLRADYGLSKAVLARILGVSVAALGQLENGQAGLSAAQRKTVERVEKILARAAQAMHREYIPTWLEKPSPACAEIGARAPIDLIERGDYDTVEDLLFFLGSGVPY